MKGFILDQSALLQCPHIGGVAQLVNLAPRVLLGGQPAVLARGAPMPVAGCPLQSQSPVFCVMANFTAGPSRVLARGQPRALPSSQARLVPTPPPRPARVFQTRVEAT